MPKLIPVKINGKVYPSVSAACRALNLNVHAVLNCMHQKNAMTAEEAIKHTLCKETVTVTFGMRRDTFRRLQEKG